MSGDDDMIRLTVRIQSETMDQLREELAHVNFEAERIRFLAQFYLDYKEMKGEAMPVERAKDPCHSDEQDRTE